MRLGEGSAPKDSDGSIGVNRQYQDVEMPVVSKFLSFERHRRLDVFAHGIAWVAKRIFLDAFG